MTDRIVVDPVSNAQTAVPRRSRDRRAGAVCRRRTRAVDAFPAVGSGSKVIRLRRASVLGLAVPDNRGLEAAKPPEEQHMTDVQTEVTDAQAGLSRGQFIRNAAIEPHPAAIA